MRAQEPFDFARAALVLLAGLVLAGVLAVRDGFRRAWRRATR